MKKLSDEVELHNQSTSLQPFCCRDRHLLRKHVSPVFVAGRHVLCNLRAYNMCL